MNRRFPPRRIAFALACFLAAAAPPPASAEGPPPPAPVPDLNSGAPPYDEGLLRLAEILGGLHYLRGVCDPKEGPLWRDQMQALIDAEKPEGERKARYVDRFNRGYESFRTVYRSCTPAASLAVTRYMEEGARIARDVAARYGEER